jgi:hypothetical protein
VINGIRRQDFWAIASLCDAFQVPKPLSPQLLPFGKSDDDLGELTFEVGLFSVLSVRRGRSVRSVFFPSSSCSCSVSFSIRRGFEFSLGKVSDSPQQRADGPRVPGGQSACSPRTVRYSGSSLEVLFAFSDGPRHRAGQSAVCVRTVRGSRPDGPRGLCRRFAAAGRTVRQSLSALRLGSFPPFLSRASACASRNRS